MTNVAGDFGLAAAAADEATLLAGLPPEKALAVRELLRERSQLSERYRRVIETTSDAIVITDLERRIAFANPAAHALFGYQGAALLGMRVAETLSPEARDAVAAFESAALAGVPQRYETVVMRANGERRTVSVSTSPLYEDGVVTGVVASLRDVTDERRARDAVARSEARYRNLVETATDAIGTLDQSGIFTSVNQAACEIVGYAREELLGRRVRGLIDPDDVPSVRGHFLAALAGHARRYECRVRRRDGERRLLSVTNTPLGQGNAIVGVLAIARDITADRERDVALVRSEARYERLVETAPDAIFTVDLDGRFTSVNQTFERTIGRGRADVVGRHYGDLLDDKQRARADALFAASVSGTAERAELRYRDVTGSVRKGSVTTAPILEHGALVGILGIVRDVTEEHQLQMQLMQREKLAAVGQLVSGVAHELNNPLAGIMAFAQLLEASDGISADQRDALETIHKEAKRAAKIVSNLLLFARQRDPERTSTDLNQVMRDTLELRRYVLHTQGIDVVTDLDPDLPLVWADAFQLQQVVLNLITNAEHALRSADGTKRIVLRTRRVGERVVASVADTGPGIAPELLPQVFNPFFTTKEVGEGTGLGLSISDGIVRQHGGQIVVDSVPGRGVTFAIELPLSEPPPMIAGAEKTPAPAPAGAHMYLIVDDEPAIRRALTRYLTGLGHTVESVDSGSEALERLRARRYDAILLDLRMPDMAGDAVFTTLRRDDPDHAARVVFATGDAESDGARAFLDGAGRPFVTKPFVLPTVARLLAAAAD